MAHFRDDASVELVEFTGVREFWYRCGTAIGGVERRWSKLMIRPHFQNTSRWREKDHTLNHLQCAFFWCIPLKLVHSTNTGAGCHIFSRIRFGFILRHSKRLLIKHISLQKAFILFEILRKFYTTRMKCSSRSF